MIRSAYEHVALIDSSAVLALHDPTEQFHEDAKRLYATTTDIVWAALDVTSHECFTRARYRGSVAFALEHYDFLRTANGLTLYRFTPEDEIAALDMIRRYSDHKLSFHDVLCAAVMKRLGILKVFTFDRDFAVLGFVLLPGPVG